MKEIQYQNPLDQSPRKHEDGRLGFYVQSECVFIEAQTPDEAMAKFVVLVIEGDIALDALAPDALELDGLRASLQRLRGILQ